MNTCSIWKLKNKYSKWNSRRNRWVGLKRRKNKCNMKIE